MNSKQSIDQDQEERATPESVQEAAEFDGLNERRHALEGEVDRREYMRYAVDAWAEVMVKDGTMLFRGRVLDLSLGGCYVETEARLRLAPGTPVEMIFRLEDRVLRCEAVSRMIRAHGAGFLFESQDGRMRRQLEAFLEALSGCET